MYDSIIASVLTFGTFGRDRRSKRPPALPCDLSEFNDHTLRDIGLRRESSAWDRRHLLRF